LSSICWLEKLFVPKVFPGDWPCTGVKAIN
jgi:hypothetical protein